MNFTIKCCLLDESIALCSDPPTRRRWAAHAAIPRYDSWLVIWQVIVNQEGAHFEVATRHRDARIQRRSWSRPGSPKKPLTLSTQDPTSRWDPYASHLVSSRSLPEQLVQSELENPYADHLCLTSMHSQLVYFKVVAFRITFVPNRYILGNALSGIDE